MNITFSVYRFVLIFYFTIKLPRRYGSPLTLRCDTCLENLCFFSALAFVVMKSTSGTMNSFSTWRSELSKDRFPKLKDFTLMQYMLFN